MDGGTRPWTWLTCAPMLLGLACSGDRVPPYGSHDDASGTTAAEAATTDEGVPPTSAGTTVMPDGTEGTSASSSDDGTTTGEPPADGPWQPGTVYPTPEGPNDRGLLDRRGIIHSHSPYSHDACDGEPLGPDGLPDPTCMEDLRRGICQTQHDFVMLTDHPDSFADTPFPAVLLFDPDRGDELLLRDADPVANWAACERDVRPTLITAGTEGATMPVGLEHHAPGGGATYGDASSTAIEELLGAGAVSLVAHTEDWDVAQLVDLPLQGFEMYNLHANLEANIGAGLELLSLIFSGGSGLPHPDLVFFPIWQEDPRYLERWGSVLAMGVHRVTTMGTDAHRNTFSQLLPDGERIDSYRRMLLWFSNHVLVEPQADGSWDDVGLKAALKSGRLYGVFEYLGYAEGFDAVIKAGDQVFEIGDEVSLADAPEIIVQRPRVQNLDPDAIPPVITMHVLRAIDGGFEVVATDADDELRYSPDAPGAYRVEVRISPLHLADWLGAYADEAGLPRVWIYANPFYVAP